MKEIRLVWRYEGTSTMSNANIPIVQGVAVPSGGYVTLPNTSNQYAQQQDSPYLAQSDFNGVKGETQPKQFQDVFWTFLFGAHLLVMVVLMALMSTSIQNGGYNYSGVVWCVSMCALVALGLSTLALGFMMQFATELVKMALFFSVGCSLALGIIGAIAGQIWMSIIGFLSFALGCCYAYFVWGRIPVRFAIVPQVQCCMLLLRHFRMIVRHGVNVLRTECSKLSDLQASWIELTVVSHLTPSLQFAAANLRTALTAVKANLGLVVIAYAFLAIAFGWSLWWSVTAGASISTLGTGALFFFLLSYYWVHQVLQNTVHVTTAGVIGTWWFVPGEASSCWSTAIQDSFCRATTYSFGSICFGSFLVALVQALRAMHRIAHENDDCSFLICLIDCILGCIEGILEYLNKWAYVYVGLYGYSYLDAGRNVMTLFQHKGWTTVITDDLADNVLVMVSVAIGLSCGLVGLIMGSLDQNLFSGIGYDNAGVVGFV
jgi:hypothetical protein